MTKKGENENKVKQTQANKSRGAERCVIKEQQEIKQVANRKWESRRLKSGQKNRREGA